MFNDYNPWENLYKNQQNMMSSWYDFMKNPKMDNYSEDFYKMFNFYKQQKEMMDLWNKFSMENAFKMEDLNPHLKEWQEVMTSYDPIRTSKMMTKTAHDVYEKIMNSHNFYLNLYNVWENINKNILSPNSEVFKKEFDKAMANYDKLLMENIVPLMPKELQGLLTNPYQYIKTISNSFAKFYAPWEKISHDLANIYMEGTLKDPAKLSEAIRVWKDAYDKTFGAMITSPVVGSSREAIEQNNKMVDALINFLLVSSEFTAKVSAVANENSKKAFESYFELLEEGSEPKTFNEFYKFWSSKVEEAIDKYFYTDEFSKMIAFLSDAGMKFKMETNKTTEKFLDNTPIVTQSELESVYKNVYDLKKEVKKLKKEVETLSKEIEKSEKTKKDIKK